MQKTLTLGPLSFIFANENRELAIPLHRHYAEVRLSYSFSGNAGFPVLAKTMDLVRQKLDSVVERPFMNTRNEEILAIMFKAFQEWECAEIAQYGGDNRLVAVELTVFGVRDGLGHAEGPATYRLALDDRA
jgi:hypothetical protein